MSRDRRYEQRSAYALPWCIRSAVRGGRLLRPLAVVSLLAAPGFAQGDGDSQSCPGDGEAPVPVEVAVTTVPIVVTSTTDDYFVLHVRHEETRTRRTNYGSP